MNVDEEEVDTFSKEDSLPCISSSLANINCNASEDGDGTTETDGLAAELEVEEEFEESTPNKESSNSLEIEPSLILR